MDGCGGAGAKADPTRIRIADISESNVDPLARAVRVRLRRDHNISAGLPVVLSTERPRCALVPAGNAGDNPLDYQVQNVTLRHPWRHYSRAALFNTHLPTYDSDQLMQQVVMKPGWFLGRGRGGRLSASLPMCGMGCVPIRKRSWISREAFFRLCNKLRRLPVISKRMIDADAAVVCSQIVPNFRVRTIPVLGTLPAMFGLAAASYVLCALAAAPFAPEPLFRLLEPQWDTQLQRLAEREDLIYGNSEGPAVDLDDVRAALFALHIRQNLQRIDLLFCHLTKCCPAPSQTAGVVVLQGDDEEVMLYLQVIYLVREVWRGLSAKGPPHVLPGGDKGFKRSLTSLTLTRCHSISNNYPTHAPRLFAGVSSTYVVALVLFRE